MAQWVESIVRARFLVASLGESASPPWWRTTALSPIGQQFLVRLFPRTATGAGLEMASRGAGIEHDSHIGRLGAYHLFRLPVAEEIAVQDLLRLPRAAAILQELAALPVGPDRLAALSALAGAESVAGAHGPLHCGAANRYSVSVQRTPTLLVLAPQSTRSSWNARCYD